MEDGRKELSPAQSLSVSEVPSEGYHHAARMRHGVLVEVVNLQDVCESTGEERITAAIAANLFEPLDQDAPGG
jgi:hypothetical protein